MKEEKRCLACLRKLVKVSCVYNTLSIAFEFYVMNRIETLFTLHDVTNTICLIMSSDISMAVALRSMGTKSFWIFPHLYEKMAEKVDKNLPIFSHLRS